MQVFGSSHAIPSRPFTKGWQEVRQNNEQGKLTLNGLPHYTTEEIICLFGLSFEFLFRAMYCRKFFKNSWKCCIWREILKLIWEGCSLGDILSSCCTDDNTSQFSFPLQLCGPTRAMASSFLRFLDHTQRRITVSSTPPDAWSERRRDLYLTTYNTHNRQTSMTRWDSNPRSQQASGRRPTPQTAWPLGPATLHSYKNKSLKVIYGNKSCFNLAITRITRIHPICKIHNFF